LVLGVLAGVARAEPYKAEPGPYKVQTVQQDWTDAARAGRVVPVLIYLPTDAAGPRPVVLFSHGLGGSRNAAPYLGQHLASHGYVAVHMQHPGSDVEVLRQEGLEALKAAATGKQYLARAADVKFVIDELVRRNESDTALKGRLDTEKIAMSGHSFGAATTLGVCGQQWELTGRQGSVADPRVKCGLVLSGQPPERLRNDPAALDRAYAAMKVPMFHLTGTKDDSPIGAITAADRRKPFDHTKAADQYLLILENADHMVFGGNAGRRRPATPNDERVQAIVKQCAAAFLDAYLLGDEKAKAWLTDASKGLKAELVAGDTYERK
jgi:predicted dienelactone hydrolase